MYGFIEYIKIDDIYTDITEDVETRFAIDHCFKQNIKK